MSIRLFSQRGAAARAIARAIALALALALALLAACGEPSGARTSVASPRATATPADPTIRQFFEQGVAYPKWGTRVYGAYDSSWPAGVQSMRDQTNATWVEMIVSLEQNGYRATTVNAGSTTTSPDALYAGILNARQAGLKVFIEPLLNVRNEVDNWSGNVNFATHAQAQLWFQSYWAAYEPYVKVAKAAGASQISIAAEYDKLQAKYPDLWMWLARQVKTTFGGVVTYDANQSIMRKTPPTWFTDPDLSAIGVSMYYNLQLKPKDLTAPQIEQLWKANVLPLLDRLSARVGKPVILTEIGYRDTSDALHDPWLWHSSAPADPTLQGAAYQAALAMTASDQHIAGVFFWAWENSQFAPAGPAIQAMRDAWAQPVAVGG